MTGYLKTNFPDEEHRFVRDLFKLAYVFPELGYGLDVKDEFDPARGPVAMRQRVSAHCAAMRDAGSLKPDVLQKILDTLEDADDLTAEVRREVEHVRTEAAKTPVPLSKKDKTEPATEKQLAYIKKLGSDKRPTYKREASRIIERLLKEQRR
jgi:hypothetical protein